MMSRRGREGYANRILRLTPEDCHQSAFNASTGLMRVARVAGTEHAMNATMAKPPNRDKATILAADMIHHSYRRKNITAAPMAALATTAIAIRHAHALPMLSPYMTTLSLG